MKKFFGEYYVTAREISVAADMPYQSVLANATMENFPPSYVFVKQKLYKPAEIKKYFRDKFGLKIKFTR